MEMITLGADIGGTKVSIGLVKERGEIIKTMRFPVKRGTLADFGLDLIRQAGDFLDETGYREKISGIGIGAKGNIDNKTNRYVRGSLFTQPDEYDLCGELEDHFGVPAFIDNDLHATVLAEARWGAGQNRDCFTYVNVGTGFAVGMIDSGRLIRGANNFSGEIGNSIFMPVERRPFIHSLESVVSGGGFDRELRRMAGQYPDSMLAAKVRGSEPVLSGDVFEAYRKGDALARDLVNDALLMLAYTIINIEHLLNSKLYIFGGGVVADGWFFERLCEEVERIVKESTGHSWTASMEMSRLGADSAGLLGAASVFLHNRNV
jgi:predicted NBD/HSP70 family sugar kinase